MTSAMISDRAVLNTHIPDNAKLAIAIKKRKVSIKPGRYNILGINKRMEQDTIIVIIHICSYCSIVTYINKI